MQSDECSTGLIMETQSTNLEILLTHTSIVPFDCNSGLTCFVCKNNVDYDNLKKHTKSHELLKVKKVCNEFDNQIVPVDVSETNCETCDLSFDLSSLIDHLVSVHNFNINYCKNTKHFHLVDMKCLECDTCFSNYSALYCHIKKCHNSNLDNLVQHELNDSNVNSEVKQKFMCSVCCKILTSKKGFRLHLKKCGVIEETQLVRNKCTKTLKIRQNVASIISMSSAIPFKFFQNRFRCFYCSKDYEDFDFLKHHTLTEHPNFDEQCKAMKMIKGKDINVKIDISDLCCKLCFESTTELKDLINHLIANHGVNYDKTVDCLQTFKIVKDNIPCPICPQTVFRYFKKLLEHLNVFHSDNNIVCAQCGLTFKGHPNYRAHMSRYHRTKACKCPDCNLEFWNLEKLTRHRANVHGTKKFKCPQCIEKFITQHLMHKHQILVHGDGHKCTYCGRMFTQNSHMKNHIRRLHLKEKNVECTVCRDKFFDRSRLNVHMVKHVGERNYHCHFCGKKFLWKKNLRGHMASHERGS